MTDFSQTVRSWVHTGVGWGRWRLHRWLQVPISKHGRFDGVHMFWLMCYWAVESTLNHNKMEA